MKNATRARSPSQAFALEICMKVGVISDTHGLLRAEALAAPRRL